MQRRLLIVASIALLSPALGACHVYYFAHARVPLSAPLDTQCLSTTLVDKGSEVLERRHVADGRAMSVMYSTPAMFRRHWESVQYVVRRDSGVYRGEVYRDSSIALQSTYVQLDRRIEPAQGALLTADMADLLLDVRDACGGRPPNGERVFSVDVRETPYRAWVVPETEGNVRARLTVDSRQYRLHWARDPGRYVLRVDTLADNPAPRYAPWLEVDTLLLPAPPKGFVVATECWRDGSSSDGTLIALVRDTDTYYFVDIMQAWALDRTTLDLSEVSATGVECLNEDWGSVLADAPRRLRASALTFTPSPGMARIYAYLTWPSFPVDYAMPKVLVDAQLVGLLQGGSFLMVEVEPGHHRVSSPGWRESAVSFEAAPDSSYFIELYKKFISWSWEANVRMMDPGAARAAIRTAAMVASSWPGTPIEKDR